MYCGIGGDTEVYVLDIQAINFSTKKGKINNSETVICNG